MAERRSVLQERREHDMLGDRVRTPVSLRQAFPAHWALERLHPYVYKGTWHLRIPGHDFYGPGQGGDNALCGDRYDGALYDLTHHGADAIRRATCKRCLTHGVEIAQEAQAETEGVDREYRGMKATLSVLKSMRKARGE